MVNTVAYNKLTLEKSIIVHRQTELKIELKGLSKDLSNINQKLTDLATNQVTLTDLIEEATK